MAFLSGRRCLVVRPVTPRKSFDRSGSEGVNGREDNRSTVQNDRLPE